MQSEDKLCVVVLFGGMSSEHEVSRVSVGNFVNNTLGTIFSGVYTPGNVLGNFGTDISGIWNANYDDASTKSKILTGMKGVLNVGLNIAGNLAAIYNLGFGTVDNAAKGAKIAEFTTVATI